MFLSKNKKNNVYPCKPQFYCINMGFKGVKIIKACFRDGSEPESNPAPSAWQSNIQPSQLRHICGSMGKVYKQKVLVTSFLIKLPEFARKNKKKNKNK